MRLFKAGEFDPDDVEASDLAQQMVERLFKVKWIHVIALVSPSKVTVQLTNLGRKKIQRLAKYLRPFEYQCFEGDFPKATAWQKVKLMLALRWHGMMLFRPILSKAEEAALTCILIIEAAKLRER